MTPPLGEKMICKVCQRQFIRNPKAKKRKTSTKIRPSNAVTCSRPCSKIYIRDSWKRRRKK